MPETPARAAERKARAREADRRRRAATELRTVAAVATYAAGVLSNGASPGEAREAAVEAAAEFAAAAGALRRLVRLRPAQRRSLASSLAARGMNRREIAARLGVSPETVWNYEHGRRGCGPGEPRATPYTARG